MKNAKNHFIEAKMHKLTESVIPHQSLFQHQPCCVWPTIQHEKLFTQNITFIYKLLPNTKLLPNHFDEYFIPLSSIHYHSTWLATSKNLFLPRVNSSSGKCSLKFIGPKVWSSLPDDIKFSTTFTFLTLT